MNPGSTASFRSRARQLARAGDVRGALVLYRHLCERDGGVAEVWLERGSLYGALREVGEARVCFERAIALRPDFAEAHCQLGVVLLFQGDMEGAIERCEEALRLDPESVNARCHLAYALDSCGQLERAVREYRTAYARQPSVPILHSIGFALLRLGRVREAVETFEEALRKGGGAESHANIAFALNYLPGAPAEEVFAAHRRWGEAVQQGTVAARTAFRKRRAGEPLRVGYVSGDFRRHSVAHFIMPLLANHDRNRVTVFGYSNVLQPDRMTERIRGLCDRWTDISSINDRQAADRIRGDAIDILVDLSGLTRGNRLRMFSLRPAPIQVTYLGYPNTTGLRAIDHRLTDPLADPVGETDGLYTESLVRLPEGFLCYEPPAAAPDVAPMPADAAGYVTFGSFNNLAKISSSVLDGWAEMLEAVPGSRLLLKNEGLADGAARERLRSEFAARGVDPARLELHGPVRSLSAHLDLYRRVDIALDTFPYNGTTTTCEAMWMGVPVVSLAGDRHAGRVGVSLLSRVGLAELVAEGEAAYCRVAVRLAEERDRLRALRRGLRARLAASPLCDGGRFAREVEAAYAEMSGGGARRG